MINNIGIDIISNKPSLIILPWVKKPEVSTEDIFITQDIINRTKETINRHLRPDKYDIKENAKKLEKIYKTKSN